MAALSVLHKPLLRLSMQPAISGSMLQLWVCLAFWYSACRDVCGASCVKLTQLIVCIATWTHGTLDISKAANVIPHKDTPFAHLFLPTAHLNVAVKSSGDAALESLELLQIGSGA